MAVGAGWKPKARNVPLRSPAEDGAFHHPAERGLIHRHARDVAAFPPSKDDAAHRVSHSRERATSHGDREDRD
jgi:hypothetical protein